MYNTYIFEIKVIYRNELCILSVYQVTFYKLIIYETVYVMFDLSFM
jgi:hypothetical protein